MARRPVVQPPEIVTRQFSSRDEIERAITKVRRRIDDVRALDPNTPFDDASVENLTLNIRETIRDVFGQNSPEFRQHQYHSIWHGSLNMMDSWPRRQAKFTAGIPQTVTMLDGLVSRLQEKAEDLSEASSQQTAGTARESGTTGRVFIGHGGSHVWRALKDYIEDDLRLECDEFNREPTAGIFTPERVQQMMTGARFAFLVMTAEDARPDGTRHARENVIHEAGLFQGRLGFRRAIILLEAGCETFTNIHGLTYISFPPNNISAAFHEVRRVLQREGLI